MSSMVDRSSETALGGIPPTWDGGALVLLVKTRFVVGAAVAVAAIALGFLAGESGGVASGRARALKLDPNTVPPEVLTALPHVGASLVDRWVKAREERPFRSLDDARARVRGLGVATLGQIAPFFEFPEGGRVDVGRSASQKTVRTAAKRRTVRRQKPASGKAVGVGQPRLAASDDL
jgi:Helix-hairpin-helix motif